MEYPQYRKYIGLETYFYIKSAKEFEETKVIGSKYSVTKIIAKQFPEQLLIQDMVTNFEDRWEALTVVEFEKKVEIIKQHKVKI